MFALDGALTALRVGRLDIVGAVSLAMVTALGGGIIRDLLIGAVPPATFSDWRYLTVATAGGLIAFGVGRWLGRLTLPINMLDAAGLSLFAVTGASKALDFGLGAAQAVILGALTGIGGGTLRDLLVRRIPVVLHSGLYAIPAMIGAGITVATIRGGVYGVTAAIAAATICFLVRMLGVLYDLNAPPASALTPHDLDDAANTVGPGTSGPTRSSNDGPASLDWQHPRTARRQSAKTITSWAVVNPTGEHGAATATADNCTSRSATARWLIVTAGDVQRSPGSRP